MNKEKVLIVEDESDIRELIHFHLYKNKYEVFEANNGSDAMEICFSQKPDLVLLDIMIPGIDGLEVCKKLKANEITREIKIIFLSAKGSEEDIVKGLELGAEDYVTKPFSPKVLMARVKNILKRQHKKSENESVTFQGISIDDLKKKVVIDESEVELTTSEYYLLKFLMTSPGYVYTRGQIVNKLKGDNHAVTDRSVDTQLVSLRKKMGEKGKLIETVRGIGYRFKEHEA